MNEKTPLIVKKDGPICTMTINNPEKRNALTPECLSLIVETFDELAQDKDIRVAIIRGKGDTAFSAGADITEMPGGVADDSLGIHEDVVSAAEAVQRYPYPVVAMLNGYTLGAGCILAMACDIRIAARHVEMGIPTSRMGLVSDYRTYRRFLTVLGYSTALELFITGRFYNSGECLNMGLVNYVVDGDKLESFTHDLTREIIKCAPLALQGSKFILTALAENPEPSAQDLKSFKSLTINALRSQDHSEAKEAFAEKRKPRFKGR
jgi:enoyl-CoA hydratase/carnithine racemase